MKHIQSGSNRFLLINNCSWKLQQGEGLTLIVFYVSDNIGLFVLCLQFGINSIRWFNQVTIQLSINNDQVQFYNRKLNVWFNQTSRTSDVCVLQSQHSYNKENWLSNIVVGYKPLQLLLLNNKILICEYVNFLFHGHFSYYSFLELIVSIYLDLVHLSTPTGMSPYLVRSYGQINKIPILYLISSQFTYFVNFPNRLSL